MRDVVVLDVYAIENKDEKAYKMCLTGKTFPHKEEIKALGFSWDGFYSWEKTSDFTCKEDMGAEIKALKAIEWVSVNWASLNKASIKLFG